MTSDKGILYYADERLSRCEDASLRLVVESADDGFSFAVRDGAGMRLAAGRVPIAFPGSENRRLEKAVRFFETQAPFSSLHFERTDILRLDTCFTFVSDAFYDPDKRLDLLSFSQGRSIPEPVLARTVGEAVCIFPAERLLSDYFASRSDRVEQRHSMEAFVQNALDNVVSQGRRSLHQNVAGGYLQTVVLEARSPILINVFRLKRPSDFMYYSLAAAEKTGTDISSADFVFYGDPGAYFDNREQLARLSGGGGCRLALRTNEGGFSPALDFVAYYDWYNVLNTRFL